MSDCPIPRRLVVLAPNWLGDAVMALPLVEDLRRGWPATEIAVAARRSIVPLFEMVPGITHTLTLDGGSGWRGLHALKRNAVLLAEGSFDAALLLPNSFQSAWIAARARIPERWGFARDLRGRLLTRALPRPKRYEHQVEYYQALASGLGLPVGKPFARIEVSGDDRKRARALISEAGTASDRGVVVFAPGAAYGRAKQWLPERFAELAAMLRDKDLATVLVGAKADASACRQISAHMRRIVAAGPSGPGLPVDLCGRTDLTTLAGLFALSAAVVSNDSGAMHLAAAAGAKVVAVFGPTDHRKTSPLRSGPETPPPVVLAAPVWCRPCMLRECPIDHRCMRRVTARAVFDTIARV